MLKKAMKLIKKITDKKEKHNTYVVCMLLINFR